MAIRVFCPNCGSEMVTGSKTSETPVTINENGTAFLVPKEIHNDNIGNKRLNERLDALKEAGINVDKLRDLMGSNSSFEDIFDEGDPIIKELSNGGFVHNKELFRRWICAQTMRLIKDPNGWTAAVRERYDTHYVYKQTLKEVALLCRFQKKCPNDKRFSFFTLEDCKSIFRDLAVCQTYDWSGRDERKRRIMNCSSYQELLYTVTGMYWRFSYKCTFKPRAWLNCFKGAGAYYTLQNLVRTHGLILSKCKDMNESLDLIDNVYTSIIGYNPRERRWDILMSVLTKSVTESNFEFKY